MSRHDLDVTSLVAGAVLLTLAVVHLVAEAQDASVDVAWLAAAALVALGVVAVTVGLSRSVQRGSAAGTGTVLDAEVDADVEADDTDDADDAAASR